MKLSVQWIYEWANPKLPAEELQHLLTMAGLPIESSTQEAWEFELTANRGDCLSVIGIAREIAALTGCALTPPAYAPVAATDDSFVKAKNFTVDIHAPADCPVYYGRIITAPKAFASLAATPAWMLKKLAASDINAIHPVVDIMNYVMLELGQPLHAFDLGAIQEGVIIRRGHENEKMILLDDKEINLSNNVLIIADKTQTPLALAGIMGAKSSAVDENTTQIFIESAFFVPHAIAGRARHYGLHTDASHRFERGVDPALPQKAIERATALMQQIYGETDLQISPLIEKIDGAYLPEIPEIILRKARLEKILGIYFSHEDIEAILKKLQFHVAHISHSEWRITPPGYRFDILEEVDVIEEIARIHGYHHIPARDYLQPLNILPAHEMAINISDLKQRLVQQGYQEVITYSFTSEKAQQRIQPDMTTLKLANPLSSEYAVMRTSIWPGLLQTAGYNINRQQDYLRLFETGLCFLPDEQAFCLAGLAAGRAHPEQWGMPTRFTDFFDVKHDIMTLLDDEKIRWQPSEHPALHPGRSAQIWIDNHYLGACGELHPELQQEFGFAFPVYLFELKIDRLKEKNLPQFKSVSRFPAIRRDLALLLEQKISADEILQCVTHAAKNMPLADASIFDVYQGKNIPAGKKSLALALSFQAEDRTLIEEEIHAATAQIIAYLTAQTGAVLRE